MAFEETGRGPGRRTCARSASTSTKLVADGKLAHRPRPRRAQRDRGDRRLRPRRAVRPPRPRDRLGRRQAGGARHDRDAVRRLRQPRPSCAPSCAGCSAGSRTRASPPSSPASAATATLTRQGLEEYVSDCVILLDHRVDDQVSTRRLRIVKYRGTAHGTNEYPFLIDEDGISVLPHHRRSASTTTSSTERVSTGVPAARRDARRQGLLPRQHVLVSRHGRHRQDQPRGALRATRPAARGERCLYFAFEESPSQIVRNMRSIGIDLEPCDREGPAALHASPPHAARPRDAPGARCTSWSSEFEPRVVVIDPISNLVDAGDARRTPRRC